MKVALTGGATGGHFYPLIAVVEGIEDICTEKRLVEPQYYYFGATPFDPVALQEHDIKHVPIGGSTVRKDGKQRPMGYFSLFVSTLRTLPKLLAIYPDVVFSTGSYSAFATLFSARLLRIPVIIYDADAKPGRTSLWSSKFAQWIALGQEDAINLFPEKVRSRIARTGHPIRKNILDPAREGGHEFLDLDPSVPTLFIMGGSQGARAINEVVLDALSELVQRYNVVHQTGTANLADVQGISSVSLRNVQHAERYRAFALLNALALKMTAGITSLILARAGSGTIFEIASWGIPAILVPIPLDVSHDQTENAFSYARAGAAEVIEQQNLTPHLLTAEVDRLMQDSAMREKMSAAAKAFARRDAGRKIAEIILETALAHEPV